MKFAQKILFISLTEYKKKKDETGYLSVENVVFLSKNEYIMSTVALGNLKKNDYDTYKT